MHIPSYYYAPVPASVLHDPTAYAFSIWGLLGANLLALEWLRQIGLRIVRQRHGWKHPVTLYRISDVALLIGILLRSFPDVLQITLWPDVTPATRFAIAHWNRILDGYSFFPMILAFMIASGMAHLDEAQIAREPIPVDLWPSKNEKARAATGCALLLFISVVIAFR